MKPDISPRDMEQLSAYIDGELRPDERAALEARLAEAENEALRRELEALRQTVALVRDLPTLSAPRDFTLSEEQVRVPRLAPAPGQRFFQLALAAMIALAVGLALFTAQTPDDLTPEAPAIANQPTAIPTTLAEATSTPQPTQIAAPQAALFMAEEMADDAAAFADEAAEAEIAPETLDSAPPTTMRAAPAPADVTLPALEIALRWALQILIALLTNFLALA